MNYLVIETGELQGVRFKSIHESLEAAKEYLDNMGYFELNEMGGMYRGYEENETLTAILVAL